MMGKFAYFQKNELFLLLVTFNFKYLFKTQNQEESSYKSNCLSVLFIPLLRSHLTLVLIHQGHSSFDIFILVWGITSDHRQLLKMEKKKY